MRITRRDFLKASLAIGGAIVFNPIRLFALPEPGESKPSVLWLQGQTCSGCSISFMNSVYYASVEDILLNSLSLKYHPTLMASAGEMAMQSAEQENQAGGYILIVEGAIPTAEEGQYCEVGEQTILDILKKFVPKAKVVLAAGTCASYGGICAGSPNPTKALGVKDSLTQLGLSAKLINIPGCPTHPDWLVGTVAMLLNGQEPSLDSSGRPSNFYAKSVHSKCPYNKRGLEEPVLDDPDNASALSEAGCMISLGCRGPSTKSDCPVRKWNSPGKDEYGVNWCIEARNPCHGCTEPKFPDGMSPFYKV